MHQQPQPFTTPELSQDHHTRSRVAVELAPIVSTSDNPAAIGIVPCADPVPPPPNTKI